MKKKNQIYKKFCRAKSDRNKQTLYEEFKKYRNTILKLKRLINQNIIKHFFLNIRKTKKKHGRGLNQSSIFPKNQTRLSTVLTLMIRR